MNFAKTVADQIGLGRLHPLEPGLIRDDPLAYLSKKKYLGGAAKEAVEGYFMVTSEDAFEEVYYKD